MKIPKKEFFFQNLALAQLPKLPEMRVDTLHQLQIKVGLPIWVICHYKFIFFGVVQFGSRYCVTVVLLIYVVNRAITIGKINDFIHECASPILARSQIG